MSPVTNLPEGDGRGSSGPTQHKALRPAQPQVQREVKGRPVLSRDFLINPAAGPRDNSCFFLWLWMEIDSLETTNEEENSLSQVTYGR